MASHPSFESTHLLQFEKEDGVLPSRLVKMYAFFGDLARFGSIADSGESRQTPVRCRKRPGRKQCQGLVSVRRRDLPAVIEWRCPDCEAAGQISGWEESKADLRGLEGHASSDATKVPITVDAHRELRQLARDDAIWRPLVYGAEVHDGVPALSVTRDQAMRFSAMATSIALALSSGRRRGLFGDIAFALALPFASQIGSVDCVEVSSELEAEFIEAVMSMEDFAAPQLVPTRPRPRPRSTNGMATRVARTYRLKVTLRDVKPPVWRRLIVPAGISLSSLHEVLQAAMGWHGGHLHLFRVGNHEYAPPGDWEPVGEDSTGVALCDLAPRKGSRLIYEYDFGDGWRHDIHIEDVFDQKCTEVRCLTGRRSCPPEDCGGPWGYQELRAALADPEHERHAELREWMPVGFDAEEFDVVWADDLVRRIGV